MGDIRKINDEYYLEFHARGLLYQQKAGKDIARPSDSCRDRLEDPARRGRDDRAGYRRGHILPDFP